MPWIGGVFDPEVFDPEVFDCGIFIPEGKSHAEEQARQRRIREEEELLMMITIFLSEVEF